MRNKNRPVIQTSILLCTNVGSFLFFYRKDMVGTVTRPVKELKSFQQVFIKKGESTEVVFTLGVDDLKFYNNDLNFVSEPGDFKVFVGGNSRDTKMADFVLTN